MPRPILIVATAFALVAGACAGDDAVSRDARDAPTTARAAPRPVALELTADQVAFDKVSLQTGAGAVSIRFNNQDEGIAHNLHVVGSGVDNRTEITPGPARQSLDLDLDAGRYSYVCDVHPQQMTGVLTVS